METPNLVVLEGGGEPAPPDPGEARLEIEDHIATVQFYPRQSPDGIGSAASFWGNGSIPTCASGNYCYSNSWDGVTGLP